MRSNSVGEVALIDWVLSLGEPEIFRIKYILFSFYVIYNISIFFFVAYIKGHLGTSTACFDYTWKHIVILFVFRVEEKFCMGL